MGLATMQPHDPISELVGQVIMFSPLLLFLLSLNKRAAPVLNILRMILREPGTKPQPEYPPQPTNGNGNGLATRALTNAVEAEREARRLQVDDLHEENSHILDVVSKLAKEQANFRTETNRRFNQMDDKFAPIKSKLEAIEKLIQDMNPTPPPTNPGDKAPIPLDDEPPALEKAG